MIKYIKKLLGIKSYYFVSYAHKDGFGRISMGVLGYANIRQLELEIMESQGKEEVLIIFYKRISKKQSKEGLI